MSSSDAVPEPYVENENHVPSGTDQHQIILTSGAVDDIADQMNAASPAFAEAQRVAIQSAAQRSRYGRTEEEQDEFNEAAAAGEADPITAPVPTPGQVQAATEGTPEATSTAGNTHGTLPDSEDVPEDSEPETEAENEPDHEGEHPENA